MCTHPEDKIRFLTCSCADRFPGKWVCDACGDSFRFDPNNPKGVHYLDKPNEKLNRGAISYAKGGEH